MGTCEKEVAEADEEEDEEREDSGLLIVLLSEFEEDEAEEDELLPLVYPTAAELSLGIQQIWIPDRVEREQREPSGQPASSSPQVKTLKKNFLRKILKDKLGQNVRFKLNKPKKVQKIFLNIFQN